mmetsp:Transcript_27592/g.65434  ORF Transcript_27592/g.65434 Transcript_27592/m.65434 type:complete len:223 (+) Transcript_27592:343-1011(+)
MPRAFSILTAISRVSACMSTARAFASLMRSSITMDSVLTGYHSSGAFPRTLTLRPPTWPSPWTMTRCSSSLAGGAPCRRSSLSQTLLTPTMVALRPYSASTSGLGTSSRARSRVTPTGGSSHSPLSSTTKSHGSSSTLTYVLATSSSGIGASCTGTLKLTKVSSREKSSTWDSCPESGSTGCTLRNNSTPFYTTSHLRTSTAPRHSSTTSCSELSWSGALLP